MKIERFKVEQEIDFFNTSVKSIFEDDEEIKELLKNVKVEIIVEQFNSDYALVEADKHGKYNIAHIRVM